MRTILFSLGLLFLGLSGISQQVAKSLTYNGTFVGFYEYKPTNYDDNKNKKYPLIIFLHGIGERGNGTTELPYVLSQGIPKNIRDGKTMTFTVNGKTETFMVLSPQLPKWLGAWDNVYVDALLDYAKKNLRVDQKRIFLTGLSLGGGGVWSYVTSSLKNAKQFAAIAPICGVCYYDLRQLEPTVGKANIGVWGFTNMDDNIVSPWCTIAALDELEKNKSKKIKRTINKWGGHDAWTRAYDVGSSVQSPNLYEWFLSEGESADNSGNSDNSAEIPANTAPVAKAGNDITITLPDNDVTLSNAGSYDADGNIKGWNWAKLSGPAQGTIESANNASTEAKNLVAGTYVFQLTVTDNDNAIGTDEVTVVVKPAANAAPVAKAGNDISITLPNNDITLSNAGSYDSDGDIKGWNWSKVSGPVEFSLGSANSASTSVKNLVAGTYVFRLTVTDNDNATSADDVTVTVYPPKNVAPVAKAGNDISITLPVSSATLSNAGSYDSDGSIKAWNWKKVSGPSEFSIAAANDASTAVNNLVQGTYVFRLTVTDNNDDTDSDEVTVVVNRAPNVAPVAKAGNDINLTLPANATKLNNAGSYDSDGRIKEYRWSKVSGPSQFNLNDEDEATAEVKNLEAGSYTFRLTVTDDDGASNSDDIIINVNRAPNVAPVAKAGNDINISLPVNSAKLNNAGSYDSDGKIKAYKWSKISGPSQFNLNDENEASAEVKNLQAGSYTFRLTVTDDDGATDSDDIIVNVNRAPNTAPVAKAGNDILITLPVNSASLTNAGSYDADGRIKEYNWSKVSGPSQFSLETPNAANSLVNNLQAGQYVFRLTVTDDDGSTDSDDLVVNVNGKVGSGRPPVANAGKDEKIPVGQATVLRGEKSESEGGSIRSYVWTKFSGPASYEMLTPNAPTTWIRNMEEGVYVYRLTVTDDKGAVDTDDVTITVSGSLPIALAGKDETIPVGQATVLRGEKSYVLGGYIKTYSWSKLSGPSSYEITDADSKNTWIRNMTEGVYVYRLTIKDNNGFQGVDDVVITVKGGGIGIVANAGKDESIPEGQATVLRGDNSSGRIRSYEWSKVAGPNKYEILSPESENTWLRNLVPGNYTFRLKVTDQTGAVATDDVTISVYGGVSIAGRNAVESNGQVMAPVEATISATQKLNIYPNPVVSALNIRWSSEQKGNATINIVDAGGRIVKTVNVKKENLDFNTSIEVNSLVPGIYNLQILLQNGKPINKQFLKR